MLREWNRETLSYEGGAFYDQTSDTWAPRHPFLDHGYGTWGGTVAGELAAFLASADDPEAGAALFEKLDRGSFLHKRTALFAGLGTETDPPPRDPSMRRLRLMCESLLIAELGNRGASGACVTADDLLIVGAPVKDQEHFDLRWCDEAARHLAHARPSRYRFDWATPPDRG